MSWWLKTGGPRLANAVILGEVSSTGFTGGKIQLYLRPSQPVRKQAP